MATVRANSWAGWAGSSRVVWLLAALLILMALLGLLGAASLGSGTAGSSAGDFETALRPCSRHDVRVERARALAATLLPRHLRAPTPQMCAARC